MWCEDERDHSRIHPADSSDLHAWTRAAPPVTDQPQEGPTAFRPADAYRMMTDNRNGLSVRRSTDLDARSREPYQLPTAAPEGHHAMAVEQGECTAVLYCFTADGSDPAAALSPSAPRAWRYATAGSPAPRTPR
ncbi:hypothetical protein [Streptomyces viridochromogenes]|nr:hypothetical protein [Streptomyces viridochromogenes]